MWQHSENPGDKIDYYNKTDKRLEFVEELQRAHPDVVQLTQKWGRWHHHVDYSGFKQQLKRKPGVPIPEGVNNFGMTLQERIDGSWKTIPETNVDTHPAQA